MPYENLYIQKVKNISQILINTESIYKLSGKWEKYFFKNSYPIYLEIGTGQWNFFAKQVGKNPKINFIGIEIKRKRLFSTFTKSQKMENKNFVVIRDFAQNINKIFWKNELSKTYIYFPDPRTKKSNQQKNQLLQIGFLEDLFEITKKNGTAEIKTDDIKYFEIILQNIYQTKWSIIEQTNDYETTSNNFSKDTLTEFEWIWRGKNKKIWYIELKKIKI